MKKPPLLVILMILVCHVSFGQNLQFGIRAGLSFASQAIDNPDIISTNSVTTYNLSVVVEKPLKNSFYLQSGLGITGKGVITYENAQTATYKLTYIDIPLNLLYKFNLPGMGKLYVGTGPYLSIGLSGNVLFENSNNSNGENLSFGSSQDYKRLDTGVNLTSGFELNNHLTFNTNYALGLNNIATTDPTNTTVMSTKNRVFSIGLGFLF
ncbi:porin family protein [Mucilaginibacter sp. AW1-3]